MATLKCPKFGFRWPAKILRAVDFPMPLVPIKPRTWPGVGTGNLQFHIKAMHLRKPKPELINHFPKEYVRSKEYFTYIT